MTRPTSLSCATTQAGRCKSCTRTVGRRTSKKEAVLEETFFRRSTLNRALVVLLAMLFVAAAAWGQGTQFLTYTPNADPLLGPHNYKGAGCTACHAPHGVTLEGSTGYLWGLSIPLKAYTVYAPGYPGGTNPLNTSSLLTQDPITGAYTANNAAQVDTAMCLSCHDTAFSGIALSNPNNQIVDSGGTSLNHNHPVDVAYPLAGSNVTLWVVNVTAGVATFKDASATVFGYGHPAKLFVYNSAAYVECGSCHNPHNFQVTVVTQSGGPVAVQTAHFVRGQYDTTANQQNFCVSCHADKSGAWDGQGDQ